MISQKSYKADLYIGYLKNIKIDFDSTANSQDKINSFKDTDNVDNSI